MTYKRIKLALAVAFPILFTMLLTPAVFHFPCELTCQNHADQHCCCQYVCADLEAGRVYTPEQLEMLESLAPLPGFGTKTPPPAGFVPDGSTNHEVTVVVDFKDFDDPMLFTDDRFGNKVGPVLWNEYGFQPNEVDGVKASILAELQDDYFHELADFISLSNGSGMELKLNIIEGEIGTPPPGVAEYYFVQVGTGVSGPCTGFLGCAFISAIRNQNGDPSPSIEIGDVVGSTFTNSIIQIGGLSPPDALRSGNVEFTTNAIVGTLSHEIGHAVSLSHVNYLDSIQPTRGRAPIMGTGAIDLPNQRRIEDREFSIAGLNDQANGNLVLHINQLVDAISLQEVIFPLGDVNCDWDVNFLDISPFIAAISNPAFDEKADINGDGFDDFLDISPFIKILSQQ